MKKGDLVSFEGLVVDAAFEDAMYVVPPEEYYAYFEDQCKRDADAFQKYGTRMRVKGWNVEGSWKERFPKGSAVDVHATWNEWKGAWELRVDEQRDNTHVKPAGSPAESFDQRPIASVPTASGKPNGKMGEGEWDANFENDFGASLAVIRTVAEKEYGEDAQAPLVIAAAIGSARAAAISKSIARGRKEIEPDIPF